MRIFFGVVFLLTTAALVAVDAGLYLDSLVMELVPKSYGSSLELACAQVVPIGHALLIAFLVVCSSALSLLPIDESVFNRLYPLWHVGFLIFAGTLSYSQFLVVQRNECEDDLGFWAKVLLTSTVLVCFVVATIVRQTKWLGAAYLLGAIGYGSIITLSLLGYRVDLSVFGYFAHLICLVGLVIGGARMVLEREVFEEMQA